MSKSKSKICWKCKKNKKIEDFHNKKYKTKNGYVKRKQSICSDCSRRLHREWRKNNPEKVLEYREKYDRNRHLVVTFGITKKQYDEMLNLQNNCCKICGKNKSNFKTRLAVDHCHSTSKIRGLLCINCNRGLGAFNDDKKMLILAIKYLEEYETDNTQT